MNIKSFLKLVEIRTKLASMIPFLLGTIFALYRFQAFKVLNFLLMLGSLIIIDMTTTAINNFYGYKTAKRKYGYNYDTHNAIVKYNLKEGTVVATILVMLAVAVLLGILLVINTNIIVLALGAISFAAGICYSFGPVSISRTPLGEAVSGFFMGGVILYLSLFIHIYDQKYFAFIFDKGTLSISIDLPAAFSVILLSLVPVCCIANIMLANNICDMEEDIENERYTLPVYVGRKHSLWIFAFLYSAAYADIIVLAILRTIPAICLISLVTILPVYRNIKKFYALQTKKDTFGLSVKNFLFIAGLLTLLFWAEWAVRVILLR